MQSRFPHSKCLFLILKVQHNVAGSPALSHLPFSLRGRFRSVYVFCAVNASSQTSKPGFGKLEAGRDRPKGVG